MPNDLPSLPSTGTDLEGDQYRTGQSVKAPDAVCGEPVDALTALQNEVVRCPFHDLLQLQAVSANDGETVIRLPHRSALGLSRTNENFHGGVLAALVDITAHSAIAILSGAVAPTVDLRIDYLKPANGSYMEATARVLRAGRTLARVDVTVRNPQGETVVCGRGTFATPGAGKSPSGSCRAADVGGSPTGEWRS
jgi:uncharacterized protein (TIGR00369 family)